MIRWNSTITIQGGDGAKAERNNNQYFVATDSGCGAWAVGRAKLTGEGFAGELPQLFIVSQRTQQNKNFVAFVGHLCYNYRIR